MKTFQQIFTFLQMYFWQLITVDVTVSASTYNEETLQKTIHYKPDHFVFTLEIINQGTNSVFCMGSKDSPIEVYPGMSKTFGQDSFKRLVLCHKIWFKPIDLRGECDKDEETFDSINQVQFIKEHLKPIEK